MIPLHLPVLRLTPLPALRLFAFWAAFLLSPLPATAQTAQEAAQSADVFMAFFKTGGANPDFDKMARLSPDYRLVPRARQKAFIAEEKQRLFGQWQAYDPEKDLLLVRVPVFVELNHAQSADGRDVRTLTLTLEQGDLLYFPYEYMDYKIALMPQKADELLFQEIRQIQYDTILASMEGKRRGMAQIWFRLKPVKSYLNQPYDIGGTEQWVMLANVAGLSLNSVKGQNLWNYSAPWYVSPVKNDLLDIYDDQKAEKDHEMATENPVLPAKPDYSTP